MMSDRKNIIHNEFCKKVIANIDDAIDILDNDDIIGNEAAITRGKLIAAREEIEKIITE